MGLQWIVAGIAMAVEGVPIQPKSLHGSGTEVFIGTPARKHFLAPDFGSTETRLFASADIRSPFLPPMPHSDSLAAIENASYPFVDNATFAGMPVSAVAISLVRHRDFKDLLHIQSSGGRLGLGPRSAFAQAYNISLSAIDIELADGSLKAGTDVELIGAIPDLTEAGADITMPVIPGSSAWAVNASLHMNGHSLTPGNQAIELDPSASGIEFPPSALPRLKVVMQLVSRESMIDGTGRLWLPCDASGSYTIDARFEMTAVGGGSINLNRVLIAGIPDSPNRHPVTRTRMCFTAFKMVPTVSTWRMNPLIASAGSLEPGGQMVFLDSLNERIVFRFPAEPTAAIPVVPGLAVPTIPLFSDFSFKNVTDETVELHFPAHAEDEEGVARYVLQSARPSIRPNGQLIYTFTPVADPISRPTMEVRGVYKLTGTGELRVNADKSLSLPLVRVDESSSGRKFRISIQQSHLFINLIATPVTAGAPPVGAPVFAPALSEIFERMLAHKPAHSGQ